VWLLEAFSLFSHITCGTIAVAPLPPARAGVPIIPNAVTVVHTVAAAVAVSLVKLIMRFTSSNESLFPFTNEERLFKQAVDTAGSNQIYRRMSFRIACGFPGRDKLDGLL